MVIQLAFHINISLLFIITLKCPWFITVDPLLSGIYYLSRKVYETFDSFLKLLFPLASHSLPLSLFLLIFVVCRIQTLLFGPCMLLGLFFTEKKCDDLGQPKMRSSNEICTNLFSAFKHPFTLCMLRNNSGYYTTALSATIFQLQ